MAYGLSECERDYLLTLSFISACALLPLVTRVLGLPHNVGNISALRPEEWKKRKQQYRDIAEQHLRTCRYQEANLYLRQKQFWTAKE